MEFIFIIVLVFIVVKLEIFIFKKNSFKNFEYRCYFEKNEVMEGDEVDLIEVVENHKMMPLPWLKSEITSSKWLDFAGAQSIVTDETRFVPSFFMLKSYHKTTRRWHVKCLKRGVYPIDKVVVVTTDLFGSYNHSNVYNVNTSLTVLPAPADLTNDFESAQNLGGDVIVRRNYIDDPFYRAGVREYTPRDPLSRIHWLATAKANTLMVHNNQYTADQDLLVILNVQSREYENYLVIDKEKVENGIKICAGFFEDTIISGIPVRFAANASLEDNRNPIISNSFHGDEHIADLMQTLAHIPLKSSDAFSVFLDGPCRELSASDIVIVTPYISDFIFDFAKDKMDSGSRVKIIYTSALTDENVPDGFSVFGYNGKENCVS